MTPGEAGRRRNPRVWDTDWLVLRELSSLLADQLKRVASKGSRLLDFGCGSMPYRSLVEATGAAYTGADFDLPGAAQIGDDGSLPLRAASFDTVLSVQVLEHVRDLDRYLGEARRVLKKDGVLLLSTHGSWLYHPHPEDHRRWTRTGLVADIEARGFKVEDMQAIAGPLATTTVIRLTGYAFFLRRLPVIGRVVAGVLAVCMNVRAWIEDQITPIPIKRDNACIYLARCVRT